MKWQTPANSWLEFWQEAKCSIILKPQSADANWGLYRYAGRILLPDTQFFDKLAVTLEVVLAEIGKQALTLSNQFHKAAVSAEILLVLLEMGRQSGDTLGQQSDLAFDRAGVFRVATIGFENLGFFLNG
jgi:hypothetical protein